MSVVEDAPAGAGTGEVEAVATAPPGEAAEGRAGPAGPVVHRLRDLQGRERWWAGALAVALLLMPVGAFLTMTPDWRPEGDPALMAMRALDVGTDRTPLLGQPSTSDIYVDEVRNVSHLGPLHFYVMALPVRVLGADYGMLLVSLLTTSTCVLIAAWAIFRQLGKAGGVLGAVVLGAITFTTGASSLTNPVSSNYAGYPVLCSMVLLWCLLCGDLRLLPLAAVVLSYAAQQHLSAVPSLLIATLLVGAIVVVVEWRARRAANAGDAGEPGDTRERRRQLLLPVGLAVGLAGLLWAPILLQQLFGAEGNLAALVEFTRHDDRRSVGLDSAFRQMAHVVGFPPMLGQLNATGYILQEPVSPARALSAIAVLAATAAVAFRARRTSRPRLALGVMAGILVLAGLYSGSSVPFGIEVGRLVFYHWLWPLSLMVVLGLGMAVIAWWQRVSSAERPVWAERVRLVAVPLAVVLIAGPAIVNPTLDRRSNKLAAAGALLPGPKLDELADDVVEHRDAIGDQTVVLERGARGFEGFGAALSFALERRDVEVRMPMYVAWKHFVHNDRAVDPATVESGLVLVMTDGFEPYDHVVPGQRIAHVATTDFDQASYDELYERLQVPGDEVVLGPDLEEALGDFPGQGGELMTALLGALPETAVTIASNPALLTALRDHPPERPDLDPDLIDRVLASLEDLPDHQDLSTSVRVLDVYLLDRDALLAYARPDEIAR